MLKIENLAVSKELGHAEMSTIVGGSDFYNAGTNVNSISGLAAGATQYNSAGVTQVDASQHQKYYLSSSNNSLFAVGSLVGGVMQK
jgi:hypothetical protein